MPAGTRQTAPPTGSAEFSANPGPTHPGCANLAKSEADARHRATGRISAAIAENAHSQQRIFHKLGLNSPPALTLMATNFYLVVARGGIEPPTRGFSGRLNASRHSI